MIPYDRPRGAIHDLEHIESLSTARNILLCVSERTHYILQNLAGLDAGFAKRYAIELLEGGYISVTSDDPAWSVFIDTTEAVELEVEDVNCDLIAVLQELSETLAQIPQGQNWGEIYGIPGYETAPYYDPAPYEGEPPGSETKCTLAWSFATDWAQGMSELLRQRNLVGVGLGIGAVGAILALVGPPVAAIAAIVLLIVELVLDYDIETTEGVISDLVPYLACSTYAAADVEVAKLECEAYIQAAPSMNQRTKDILKAAITYASLNRVFDSSYPPRAGMPTDCSECLPECDHWFIVRGTYVSGGTLGLVVASAFYSPLWQVWVYWDSYSTNGGRAYCLFEDGVNITNITATNNNVGGYVYDRNNQVLDEFHLNPANENLPVFPYLNVGHIEMFYNTGQSGTVTFTWEEPT